MIEWFYDRNKQEAIDIIVKKMKKSYDNDPQYAKCDKEISYMMIEHEVEKFFYKFDSLIDDDGYLNYKRTRDSILLNDDQVFTLMLLLKQSSIVEIHYYRKCENCGKEFAYDDISKFEKEEFNTCECTNCIGLDKNASKEEKDYFFAQVYMLFKVVYWRKMDDGRMVREII